MLKTIREKISLDGKWGFKLDPKDEGKSKHWFDANGSFLDWKNIRVPGCWQVQGFGEKKTTNTSAEWEVTAQKIKAEYTGTGWYKRKVFIPEDWGDKIVWLKIGAVYPACEIWINEKLAGAHQDAFIPYRCNITSAVRFGEENIITIRVSEKNRFLGGKIFYFITNWSGLYRRVEIEATNKSIIEDIHIIPKPSLSRVNCNLIIFNYNKNNRNISIIAKVISKTNIITGSETYSVMLKPGTNKINFFIGLSNPRSWSPEDSYLYQLEVSIIDSEEKLIDFKSEHFGMYEIKVKERHIYLNGNKLFLRGYGDNAVFPDTFCPSADKEYYKKKLKIAKSYGFNFVNCYYGPSPEFLDAADEVGILVQEGAYLSNDGIRVNGKSYSLNNLHTKDPVYILIKNSLHNLVKRDRNHPSILSYIPSAELNGNAKPLIECYNELYDMIKKTDPVHLVLSRAGGNIFNNDEKTDFVERFPMRGPCEHPQPIGSERERFYMREEAREVSKPYILHEYGYTSSYPDPKLKKHYKGGLLPYWLDIAEQKAKEKGIWRYIPKFVENSQKLQRIIRKLAIEEARKIPEVSGYIWWLFNDCVWAIEGIVDDFYRQKNVSPDEFIQCNGPTVLLINRKSPTANWQDNLDLEILVSHHGPEKLSGAIVAWELKVSKTGETIANGIINEVNLLSGNGKIIKKLSIPLPPKNKPEKVTLAFVLRLREREITRNSWDFWIFPNKAITFNEEVLVYAPHYWLKGWINVPHKFYNLKGVVRSEWFEGFKNCRVIVTDIIDKHIADFLKKGGRIIMISKGILPELPCEYRTVMWNGDGDKAGTLGTIIDNHPSLGDFPHEGWCDLQFRSLFEGVGSLNLDAFPVKLKSIIRIIDGYRWCRNRAHLVEFKVGKGKVLATSFNFFSTLGVLPEANYLFGQIVKYTLSNRFNPKKSLSLDQFVKITPTPSGRY